MVTSSSVLVRPVREIGAYLAAQLGTAVAVNLFGDLRIRRLPCVNIFWEELSYEADTITTSMVAEVWAEGADFAETADALILLSAQVAAELQSLHNYGGYAGLIALEVTGITCESRMSFGEQGKNDALKPIAQRAVIAFTVRQHSSPGSYGGN